MRARCQVGVCTIRSDALSRAMYGATRGRVSKELLFRYDLKNISRKWTSSSWVNFFPALISLSWRAYIRISRSTASGKEKKCAMQTMNRDGPTEARQRRGHANYAGASCGSDCGGREESRRIKWAKKREHNTISITKRGGVRWIQIPVFPDCPSTVYPPGLSLFGPLWFPSTHSVNARNGMVCISPGLYLTNVLPAAKTEEIHLRKRDENFAAVVTATR